MRAQTKSKIKMTIGNCRTKDNFHEREPFKKKK